ncbi:MAG: Ig-like domain-containing protein [Chitinophagales bacterium]
MTKRRIHIKPLLVSVITVLLALGQILLLDNSLYRYAVTRAADYTVTVSAARSDGSRCYRSGDVVNITGMVSMNGQPAEGCDIGMVVIYSDQPVRVWQLVSSANGQFNAALPVTAEFQDGSYTVRASCGTMVEDTFQVDNSPSIVPDNSSQNISVKTSIVASYSCVLKKGKGYSKIRLTDGNGKKVSCRQVLDGTTFSLQPRKPLGFTTTYSLNIPANAFKTTTDESVMNHDCISSFTTEAPHPPGVANSVPENGGSLSCNSPVMNITFNEPVFKGSRFSRITLMDTTIGKKVSLKATIDGYNLFVVPRKTLLEGHVYSLSIPAKAVKDDVKLDVQNDFTIQFTATL